MADLVKISDFAQHIPQLAPGFFNQTQLVRTFRNQIRNIGFKAASRIQLDDAAKAFSSFCIPLRVIEEFQSLPSSPAEAKSQLSRLLQQSRGTYHPLRAITLAAFLFESWNDFISAYQSAAISDLPTDVHKNTSKAINHIALRAVELLSINKLSCNAVANELGVDITSVMAWAADAGITVKRRPKILKAGLRELAIADIMKGHDKSEVSLRHGISIETVTRLLSTEVGLRSAWNQARLLAAQTRCRHAWTQVALDNPMLGAKAVRILEPAAYAWLYRNDRAWLSEQLLKLPKAPRSNNSSVDWDRRDSDLASLVAKSALSISQEMPRRRITLQMLYQHIPALKAKLSRLDRLPLTKRAIEAAISASKSPTIQLFFE